MPAVFISYSRSDKGFVERLHDALRKRDFDVWVDWEDIPPSAKWFDEIRAGVGSADGFIYVISPDSVVSRICTRELEHAAEQRKRIVPIVHREPAGAPVPDEAASLNWVFLRDEDDFDAGMETLVAALQTDLEHVRTHTRLGVAAARWDASGRDRSQLLRGAELTAAEAWLASVEDRRPEPTQLQREYVHASRQGAVRRQRTLFAGVTFALLVAVVLAIVALIQRSTAIHERNVAFARALDAEAQNQYTKDPELSVLLAAKAAQVDTGTLTERALRDALTRSHVRQTFQAKQNTAGDALWSPDGTRLLVTIPGIAADIYSPGTSAAVVNLSPPPSSRNESSWDAKGDRVVLGGGAPAVYDARTGRRIGRVPGAALYAALSSDGTRVATVDISDIGHVFDVATGRQLASFRPAYRAGATCFAWSPDDSVIAQCDAKSLATSASPAALDTWDPRTGRLLHSVIRPELIGTVAFSPNGKRYVFTTTNQSSGTSLRALETAAGQPGTFVYDSRTGSRVIDFVGGASVATFSPDDNAVAYATIGDDVGHIHNFVSGLQSALIGHSAAIETIRFNRAGTDVVTAGVDDSARVYDASTGNFLEQLAGHTASVRDASFGLADKMIATASEDGTVRLWAGPDPRPFAKLSGKDLPATIGLTTSGGKIVEAGRLGQGRILDARDLHLLARFAAPPGQGFAGAGASRDGRLVAALSGPLVQHGAFVDPAVAETFDARSGRLLAKMTPTTPGAVPINGTLDYAGDKLVTVGANGDADEWDPTTGRHLFRLPGVGPAQAVAYSNDGSMLAIAHSPRIASRVTIATRFGQVTIDLWDPRTGRHLRRITEQQPLRPQIPGTKTFSPLAIAFSPDGRLIAVSGAAPYIELYATRTGDHVGHLNPGEYAVSLAFSPDGKLLAAGTAAGAFVWRLPSATPLPEFQHADPSQFALAGVAGVYVGFTADSRILATVGDLALEAWDPAAHIQLFKAFAVRGSLSTDGTKLVTADASGVGVYQCDLCGGRKQLLAVASRRTASSVTPLEQATYRALIAGG